MAEGCLLAQPVERILWRKQSLKFDESAAIINSKRKLQTTQQNAVTTLWYMDDDIHFAGESMAETYAQMEERTISNTNAVTAPGSF